jgi:hypothetical protein
MATFGFLTDVVLPALSGGAAGWALLHFCGQRLVDHKLAKDLERYRVELSDKTEALKTQLSVTAHALNVAASRVDSQRSTALHNIYAAIRGIINPVSSLMAGCPIQRGTSLQAAQWYFDHAQEAHAAVGRLTTVTADNAIYVPNTTYVKIVSFAKAAMGATGAYLDPLHPLARDQPPEAVVAEAEANKAKLTEAFNASMRPLGMELTGEIRALLGIEALPSKGEL